MSGCMRDILDSRLNVESEKGKVKGLAVTTASIEDSMMLARPEGNEASYDALQNAQPHNEPLFTIIEKKAVQATDTERPEKKGN
jgi:hypothetical protein